MRLSITIITLNEKDNIARAIESARWADEILVVDSGSTDGTQAIAKRLGAKLLENPWPGYGKQKNFAQDNASHDWILNIDADEVISPELASEIQQVLRSVVVETSTTKGFEFPRKTFYLGRWIQHGGWYPNYLVRLADRRAARWSEPEVHEALLVTGGVQRLVHNLHHYTFAGIQDQILTNLRYSRLGYLELLRRGQAPSLLRLLVKPIGKFFETYVLRRGFLDGLPGFIISVNAAHSMFLKYSYLFEAELQSESPDHR